MSELVFMMVNNRSFQHKMHFCNSLIVSPKKGDIPKTPNLAKEQRVQVIHQPHVFLKTEKIPEDPAQTNKEGSWA